MHLRKRAAVLAAAAAGAAALSPSVASAAITPSPYVTSAATGSIVLSTVYGRSRCDLSGVTVQARSTATGATGTIAGFPTAPCIGGIMTSVAWFTPIAFTVDSGAVTVSFAAQKRSVIGLCRYPGTLTGTMANGAASFNASGRTGPPTTISGVCEPGYPTTLTLDLPGASITW